MNFLFKHWQFSPAAEYRHCVFPMLITVVFFPLRACPCNVHENGKKNCKAVGRPNQEHHVRYIHGLDIWRHGTYFFQYQACPLFLLDSRGDKQENGLLTTYTCRHGKVQLTGGLMTVTIHLPRQNNFSSQEKLYTTYHATCIETKVNNVMMFVTRPSPCFS